MYDIDWQSPGVSAWAINQLGHTFPGTWQGQAGKSRDKVGKSRVNEGTSKGKQGQA